MAVESPSLTRISGLVIEKHPKSNATWSRFKLQEANGSTVWATAKFDVELREVIVAEAEFNQKFKSYDVKSLVQNGEAVVSNEVVTLRLIDTLDGVGKIKARKLADKFPELYKSIIETPEAVAAACGVDLVKVQEVAALLTNDAGKLAHITELVNLGWPHHLAKRIGGDEKVFRIAVKSPYAAIRVVAGLGWETADAIGQSQGIKADDPERIKAGISHFYRENIQGDGHTVVTGEELLNREGLPTLLGVRPALIEPLLKVELVELGGGWYTTAFQRKNSEIIARSFLGA